MALFSHVIKYEVFEIINYNRNKLLQIIIFLVDNKLYKNIKVNHFYLKLECGNPGIQFLLLK